MEHNSKEGLDNITKPGDRVYRVPRQQPWRILIPSIPKKKVPKASLWTLVYGFATIIVVGSILLMLPFSSRSGQITPFINSLFTSTSAVCVTGLVVVDTWGHWNYFGQSVILILIQLGGFGYMTMATLFLIALGRRIGLRERLLIGESIGLSRIGGIVRLVRNMVIFTLGVEAIGAAILYIQLSRYFSTGIAIWKSVFQAVSAFNNAGFDLFGGYKSLTGFQNDYLVLLTTAFLIILGGLSFLVIEDVFVTKKFSRFSIDTKMVLTVSGLLLVLGTAVILVTEYGNPETLGVMSLPEKILNAFFQSATSRTAGFNSINTGNMTNYALFFTMLLMFIGGASGSTAGGIKVNTFGLIIASIWSAMRGKEHPTAFNRELDFAQIIRALSVLVLSIAVVAIIVFILTITEKTSFIKILFETVSAFGTVGLSTGITPDLSILGRALIILTMFIGRLGPLTLILALVRSQRKSVYRHPKGMVRIG